MQYAHTVTLVISNEITWPDQDLNPGLFMYNHPRPMHSCTSC